ncbi:MAG: hypothetical protein Tsb0015_13740 [Simkaniaceae bacterium]
MPIAKNKVTFDRVKATGFNCRKWVDPFTIIKLRKFSRSSNVALFFAIGIREDL